MAYSDGNVFNFYDNEGASSQQRKPLYEIGRHNCPSIPISNATLKTESSFQFFTISELASAALTTLPIRNYVRTVGICSGHKLDVLYLAEYKPPEQTDEETLTINANFDSTGTFPTMKSTAEVFGRIDFKNGKTSAVPVLVVWFFRELYGNITPYIDMCLKLNARRP